MDEVVDGLADDEVVVEAVAEEVVAVDGDAAGGGDAVGGVEVVEAFEERGNGIDAGAAFVGGDVDGGVGGGVVGVAGEVAVLDGDVPAGVGVVAAEPVAVVVAGAAVLCHAGEEFDLSGVGFDPEVAATDVDTVAGFDRGDGAAGIAVGEDEPAVEGPGKPVGAVLLVAGLESGEEGFALVGGAVAVGVAGEDEVGDGEDEAAVAPGEDAGGEGDALEEDFRHVVGAVAVEVVEGADAAAGLGVGVVGHFGDPEGPVGSPGEVDGVGDEGFGSDEFDLQAGGGAHGGEGFVCGDRFRVEDAVGVADDVGEGAAVDLGVEFSGVLVLEEEVGLGEECAVVGAVGADEGGDLGSGVAGVALAGETLQAPAGGLGLEEVDGVEGLVGMDDVEVAVVVEVDEAGGGSVWREVGGPAEAMFFPGAGAERVEG